MGFLDSFWSKKDTAEVNRLKSELRDAYCKSQNPSRTGQYMYSAALRLRPDGFKPFVIQLQPIGPDGEIIKTAPKSESELIKCLSPERQFDYMMWDSYEKRLDMCKEHMESDHEKHVASVMLIGELKDKLTKLIGESETQTFCNNLVI